MIPTSWNTGPSLQGRSHLRLQSLQSFPLWQQAGGGTHCAVNRGEEAIETLNTGSVVTVK